jgi:hypothetical protein
MEIKPIEIPVKPIEIPVTLKPAVAPVTYPTAIPTPPAPSTSALIAAFILGLIAGFGLCYYLAKTGKLP